MSDNRQRRKIKNANRPETNLIQTIIDKVSDAPKRFGLKTSNSEIPIVFIPKRNNPFKITVPSGCSAIMSCKGENLGVCEAGTYWRPFWYEISHLVTTHHIPYHFSIKECPTADNVLITLEVDFLLHITDPEKFVFDIGPENMEELLRATQAESVRGLVRGIDVAEAYDLRGVDSDEMLNILNDKLNKYGVNVDQVTIANVTLPSDIANSLQNATTFDSKTKEKEKQQKADMLESQNINNIAKCKKECNNEIKRNKEELKKEIQILQQKYDKMKADFDKEIAELEADIKITLQKLETDYEKQLAELYNKKLEMISTMENKRNVQIEKIIAETDAHIEKNNATMELEIAKNNANIIRIKSETESKIAVSMKNKREYDIQIAKLNVINNISKNPDIIIAGTTGDHVMQMMIAREAAKNFKKIA